MNIVDLCKILYPGEVEAGRIQFGQDTPGGDILIKVWGVDGIEKPTEQSLESQIPSYVDAFELNDIKLLVNDAIQVHLDDVAAERNYSDSISAASYVSSTNVLWKAEAEAYVAWRDSVWTYALAELTKLENNEREIVTTEQFILELPTITWPE